MAVVGVLGATVACCMVLERADCISGHCLPTSLEQKLGYNFYDVVTSCCEYIFTNTCR